MVIAPFVGELSDEYADIPFYKINVDDIDDNSLSSMLKVRVLPTILCFVGGTEVDRIEGANTTSIREMVEKLHKR